MTTEFVKSEDMDNETYWNKRMVFIHNSLSKKGQDKFKSFWNENTELIRTMNKTPYLEYTEELENFDDQLLELVKIYQIWNENTD